MNTPRASAGMRWVGIMAAGLVASAILVGPAAAITPNTDAPQPTGTFRKPLAPRSSPGVTDVVKLVDAKVDASTIQAFINNSPVAYNLTADEILALKERGVPPQVIVAMIERGGTLRAEYRQRAAAAWQHLQSPQQPTTTSQDTAAQPPANPAPSGGSSIIYSSPGYAETTPVYQPVYSYPGYSYPYYSYGGYPWYASYSWWWPYWGYSGLHNYRYHGCSHGHLSGCHACHYRGYVAGRHDGQQWHPRTRAVASNPSRVAANHAAASRSPFAPATVSRSAAVASRPNRVVVPARSFHPNTSIAAARTSRSAPSFTGRTPFRQGAVAGMARQSPSFASPAGPVQSFATARSFSSTRIASSSAFRAAPAFRGTGGFRASPSLGRAPTFGASPRITVGSGGFRGGGGFAGGGGSRGGGRR